MTIQFIGAARTVTGSKHLITTPSGKTILLDCGLYQGEDEEKNAHLGFDPRHVDHCVLSHAHIDHSGALPVLTKEGFRGRIHCTSATQDLCNIMLLDSAHIQEDDAEYISKHRERKGKKGVDPLYTKADARECLGFFKSHPYQEWFELEPGIKVQFTLVGHILGSAAVNLEIDTPNGPHRICYTGDIGRPGQPIIKGPGPFPQADTIITESTYGDRHHPKIEDATEDLLGIVEHTCVQKGGKLIIPAFSVGRTQEIVHQLDRLESRGDLPPIDTFVDSPLSTNATEIVRDHPECFNERMLKYMKKDEDPFGYDRLSYIRDAKDSIALNHRKEPCIIISASGMMEAGRIRHHLKHTIYDEANTLLIVGYCEPHSLGGRLSAGAKEIRLFGKTYSVKADVKKMEAYSAHGDQQEMIDYLSCQHPGQVQQLFLVHGELPAQEAYRDRLAKEGFQNIHIPAEKETFTLS